MRIRVVVLASVVLLSASVAYADDFGEGDIEPTGPVYPVYLEVSPTIPPTTAQNRVPVANAGPDQVVNSGALVVLSGSESKDSEGAIVSYQWRQLSGPLVELLSSRTAHPSFTAGPLPGSYVFQLTVRDKGGASAIDMVTVVVQQKLLPSSTPVIPSAISPTPTPVPPVSSLINSPITLIALLSVLLLVLIGIGATVIISGRKAAVPN